MKIKQIFLIVTFAFATSVFTDIYAQVTIGSTEEPLRGSLLDLKSEPDGTAKKGLLFPRVELSSKTSLQPLITANEEQTNPDEKKNHIGLSVYNLTENSVLCPGFYVWNGSEWMKQGGGAIDIPILKGDKESNSFIVPLNSGIEIPVQKAFDFWSTYKAPAMSKYGFNNTSGTATNVNINLSTELAKPGYKAKAILLWMDKDGLVSNVNAADNTLQITGTGSSATIRVLPSNGCKPTKGNALVAYAINDGTKDVIYWSWHVWFTDYDPNTAVATGIGAFNVTNGQVYRYNNTSTPNGNYVFMDRNLGAISNTPADNGSIGLHYQWGRKDPFPPSSNFSGYIDTNKNGTGDFLWGYYKKLPAVVSAPATTDGNNNLANSIKNPVMFYKTSTANTNDWYTNQPYTDLNGDRVAIQNDFLWNHDNKKTPFDPCPKGWQVPMNNNNQNPWFYQSANGLVTPSSFGAGGNGTGTSTEFNADKGWQFKTKPTYLIGYYPAAGSRNQSTGAIENVGTNGLLWSATPYISRVNSYVFSYNSANVTPTGTNAADTRARASALSVRCVQEVNTTQVSLIGSYNNPAKSCFEIKTAEPTSPDGEYWIKVSSSSPVPVKTFCDMTNGGYTLIWSYSENTAYNVYPPTTIYLNGTYRLNQNVPSGVVTSTSGSINYYNFRLPFSTMTNIQNGAMPVLKVRITNDTKDMSDKWGMANYAIISPLATPNNQNPFTSASAYLYYVPTVGKIFGYDLNITTTTRTYAGVNLLDAAFFLNDASYANHFNFGNSTSSVSNLMSPDGVNTFANNNLNNVFGFFGETQVNHHFGKCGGAAGDEFSFAVKTCAYTNLYPHTSINSGEGRVLQWFVK